MKTLLTFPLIVLFLIFGCSEERTKDNEAEAINDRSVVFCAPLTTDSVWYQTDNKAPFFEGLDVLNYPVTTNSEMAQKYFNQGLVLAYAFNHAEAARSFYYSTKLDPECAMCYWGYAYVLGPNYNAGMEPDNYERAYSAISKAKELTEGVSDVERALIEALSARYVAEPLEDRTQHDIDYANAMKEVASRFPDDTEVNALYAESVMDLHPWDLWTADGTAKEWTPGIIASIENVFRLDPDHPGAHHLYIHAVEASKTPEMGRASAALLDEGLVPGAGHLVHMPSHIYVRTGDYHKGTQSNIRAVQVDSNYVTMCHAQGAYPLAYYPHNYHFMAATATLEGNSKWAITGAKKLAEHSNRQVMKEDGWGTLQHFYTVPYNVYVKFGKWDEILKMDNFDPNLKYPEAVRHYARGMAFLGKHDMEAALEELEHLDEYADDKSLENITVWDINSVHTLLQIARRTLKAEILASQGAFDESIGLLKEAVEIEDNLNYNEPPDWFFSVRHRLGAVMVEAGLYEEALAVYREDLERLPKNGWALHGMKAAYDQLGDESTAAKIAEQLDEIWATADVELTTSRIK